MAKKIFSSVLLATALVFGLVITSCDNGNGGGGGGGVPTGVMFKNGVPINQSQSVMRSAARAVGGGDATETGFEDYNTFYSLLGEKVGDGITPTSFKIAPLTITLWKDDGTYDVVYEPGANGVDLYDFANPVKLVVDNIQPGKYVALQFTFNLSGIMEDSKGNLSFTTVMFKWPTGLPHYAGGEAPPSAVSMYIGETNQMGNNNLGQWFQGFSDNQSTRVDQEPPTDDGTFTTMLMNVDPGSMLASSIANAEVRDGDGGTVKYISYDWLGNSLLPGSGTDNNPTFQGLKFRYLGQIGYGGSDYKHIVGMGLKGSELVSTLPDDQPNKLVVITDGMSPAKKTQIEAATKWSEIVLPFDGVTVPDDAKSVTFEIYWDMTNLIQQYAGIDGEANTWDDTLWLKNGFWKGLSINVVTE
jgi:hypothetical protein